MSNVEKKAPKKELVLKKTFEVGNPSAMVQLAKVLRKHIAAENLYTMIRDKGYVHVEGWQFAGGMMGTYPKIVRVQNLSEGNKKKWQADAEIIQIKDGKVVGFGSALCSTEENKKKDFDEYAVLSMAQTRAIGKAYRNLVGWVMKVAGYDGTPSEEMMKVGEVPRPPVAVTPQPIQPIKGAKPGPDGKPVLTCASCDQIITNQEKSYSERIFGKRLCRDCQKEARPKK